MSDYEPLDLEDIKNWYYSEDYYAKYNLLKELTSRGNFEIDKVYKKFGKNIFAKLVTEVLGEKFVEPFMYAKEKEDSTGLKRNCGRARMIHPLRAAFQAKKHAARDEVVTLDLLHDVLEDIAQTTMSMPKVQKELFEIYKRFGEYIGNGVKIITNWNSIKRKIEKQNTIDFKHEYHRYVSSLIENCKSKLNDFNSATDYLNAKLFDNYDNLKTMRYLFPQHQLKFLDKRAIFIQECLKFLEEYRNHFNEVTTLVTGLERLIKEGVLEIKRNRDYHLFEDEDYALEYEMTYPYRKFQERLNEWKKLMNKFYSMFNANDYSKGFLMDPVGFS
jgi:hypothetical protein